MASKLSEHPAVIIANNVGPPVPLTYAEFAEELHGFILRMVASLGVELPMLRLTNGSNEIVKITADEFAEQLFVNEVARRESASRDPKFSFPDNFALGSYPGTSGATIFFTWPGEEKGSSMRVMFGARRGGEARFVFPKASPERLATIEGLVIDYWSPREVITRRTRDRKPSNFVKNRLRDVLPRGSHWECFYERSWFWNTPPIENLPPIATQQAYRGGLLVTIDDADPHNLERYVTEAIQVSTAIAQNRVNAPTPKTRPDIGRDIYEFPIDGVPIDRNDPQSMEPPFYWILANSLNRPLNDHEIAKLVDIANQQSQLGLPTKVRWLIEGDEILEQLQSALAHLNETVTTEPL